MDHRLSSEQGTEDIGDPAFGRVENGGGTVSLSSSVSDGSSGSEHGGLTELVSGYLKESPPPADVEPDALIGEPQTDSKRSTVLGRVFGLVAIIAVPLLYLLTGWSFLATPFEGYVEGVAAEAATSGTHSYPESDGESEPVYEFTGDYIISVDGQDNRDGVAALEIRWIATGELGYIFAVYESTGYFGGWEAGMPTHCRTSDGGNCDVASEYWQSQLSKFNQG